VPSLESTRSPIHSESSRDKPPCYNSRSILGTSRNDSHLSHRSRAHNRQSSKRTPFNPSVLESSAHSFSNRGNGRELCSSLYAAPPQVSEASRRGKAASTRETRYIALHSHYCAGFSAARVSEMLRSRARRADDRTTREGAEGGGAAAAAAVVTMRSRIRYGIAGSPSGGTREMNIRFFGGYFGGRRYLASCTPRIERSKYPFPPLLLCPLARSPELRFDCTS